MQYQNNRIIVFDFLKLIAIWLVLYGHCEQHLIDIDRSENLIYSFIYTFHMPLFMMVSGYFALSSLKMPFKDFVAKKARGLLLPVLTFSTVITCLYYYGIYRFKVDLFAFALLWLEQLNTWLWFLKSLFFCFLIYYTLGKSHSVIKALIFVVCIGIIWHNIGYLLPSFAVGCLIRKYDLLSNTRFKSAKIICSLFTVFVILLSFYGNWVKESVEFTDVNSIVMLYLRQSYRIIMGICGALSVFLMIYRTLGEYGGGRIYKFLCSCGKYTLQIYVLQCVILEMVLPMYIKIPAAYGLVSHAAIFPLLSICILVACVFLARIIERFKTVNLLIFGK